MRRKYITLLFLALLIITILIPGTTSSKLKPKNTPNFYNNPPNDPPEKPVIDNPKKKYM